MDQQSINKQTSDNQSEEITNYDLNHSHSQKFLQVIDCHGRNVPGLCLNFAIKPDSVVLLLPFREFKATNHLFQPRICFQLTSADFN